MKGLVGLGGKSEPGIGCMRQPAPLPTALRAPQNAFPCITYRPVDHRLARAGASSVSIRPCRVPEWSNGSSSLEGHEERHSGRKGFHEEVRPTRWWASWCSHDIPRNPVGDGSRPAGVCEAHYVAGLPNFRQLGPRDSVSDLRTSAKLGTPEAFSHWRDSCHCKHRPLESTLRDADRVFILLSYSPGL
ncbi:unnamed protein product [Heligmosomoides polygyrus]|uniref:Uncharacterized protein n=1 Tax=Heligmosomoides polygyrus TaxID=6339 RepID=A0A183FNU0_HELPZ|nr:unnamed protein product [Heligmosomoides polygyrus]